MELLSDRLKQIVDSSHLLTDSVGIERYSRDESGLGEFPPDAVVLAHTDDELCAVLEFAAQERIPVTPRGAGTGMTGGALAVERGIVMSTECMSRIVDIDTKNLIAIVEPGVITGDLQSAVEAVGLFYPPDPASLASCSLGGNVAENAGGPRAFKYGVTRDYVLGLKLALMGGEKMNVGRQTMKGVTGLDVVSLIVGSEGALAMVSEITLKLIPKPEAVMAFYARFQDVHHAGRAVSAMIGRGIRPRTLELFDERVVDHLKQMPEWTLPELQGALLLVEVDGHSDDVEAELMRLGTTCQAEGASDIFVATDETRRREFWAMRRKASASLKRRHAYKFSEDVVVPRAKIPELLQKLDEIGNDHRVMIASFGHAGDGNLHVNILFEERETLLRLDLIRERIFKQALALGGTLSGEHGIGISKRHFMSLEQSNPLLELQRRIKHTFDPYGLMNPGKLLP